MAVATNRPTPCPPVKLQKGIATARSEPPKYQALASQNANTHPFSTDCSHKFTDDTFKKPHGRTADRYDPHLRAAPRARSSPNRSRFPLTKERRASEATQDHLVEPDVRPAVRPSGRSHPRIHAKRCPAWGGRRHMPKWRNSFYLPRHGESSLHGASSSSSTSPSSKLAHAARIFFTASFLAMPQNFFLSNQRVALPSPATFPVGSRKSTLYPLPAS